MWSAPYELSLDTDRADALFASSLQRSDQPSAAQIRQAIVTSHQHAGPYRLRRAGRAGVRRAPRDGARPDALGADGGSRRVRRLVRVVPVTWGFRDQGQPTEISAESASRSLRLTRS